MISWDQKFLGSDVRKVRVNSHTFKLIGLHCRELWINLLPAQDGWQIQGFDDSIPDSPTKMFWARNGRWIDNNGDATWQIIELETQLPIALAARSERMRKSES